jgi:hypothetical protein
MKLINIFILILILCIYCDVYAFDNKRTHPDITDIAAKNSNIENNLIQYLGFNGGLNTKFAFDNEKNILDWLKYGSDLEDVPVCRAANHFHNPLLPWNQSYSTDVWPQDQICRAQGWTPRYSNILWATGALSPSDAQNNPPSPRNLQDMGYDHARQYFHNALTAPTAPIREAHFAKTFQALGQTMHLLQDMAVPAHVRNDFLSHLIYSEINLNNLFNPADWVSNPFEAYVKKNPSLVSSILPSQIPLITITGAIVTDFWDTDGRAGKPFTQGLAESTNAGYFSDFTIPGNLHVPFVSSHTFPSPQIPTYTCSDTLPGTTKKRKYASRQPCPTDGSPVDHLAVISSLTPRLLGLPPIPVPFFNKYALDDNVHKTYANELLPRAVGYSAALLDYFFRGTIELSLPSKGVYAIATPNSPGYSEIRVKARNITATNEEMPNGSLQLVVKYKMALSDPYQSVPVDAGPEQYIVATEKNNVRTLSRTGTTELVFDLTSSPIPFWAVDVSLQVVYHGQLGNEAGAVALGTQDISEPTPIDVVNFMDLVCINNNIMTAGSPAAIAAVDFNHNGLPDYDVYPHGLTNVYLAFNGALASSTNHSATIASIPPGNYGRVFVLGEYLSLPVSVAVALQIPNAQDRFPHSTFGTFVETIEALDNQHYYPLMYDVRGITSWWYAYYTNAPYPANSTCDFSTASPNIAGPVTVTIP